MTQSSPDRVTHVAVVTSWFDAWNAGDLDALLASMHPEIEFRPFVPRGAVLSDREQFADWYRARMSGALSLQLRVFDTAALGEGRVLVAGNVFTGSDEEHGIGFTAIYTVTGGRIGAAEQYLSDTTLMKQIGILQAVLLPDGRAAACRECGLVIEPQSPIVMVRRGGASASDLWHQQCFVAAYGDAPAGSPPGARSA